MIQYLIENWISIIISILILFLIGVAIIHIISSGGVLKKEQEEMKKLLEDEYTRDDLYE